MEIKVIITCHYKPIQMAKIKKKLTKQNPGQRSVTLHHLGIVLGI